MMNTLRDLFLEVEAGTAEMQKITIVGRTNSSLGSDLSDSGQLALGYSTDFDALVASMETGAFQKVWAPDQTVTLTDGATPALDASLGMVSVGVFRLVAAGDRTIAVPSNPTPNRRIWIEHVASGGARTLALNTGAGGFRFGSDITALSQTASGKTDHIGAKWNSTDSFWDVVGYAKGF